ncbi:hypothetical protein MASR1M90_07170 [Desulfovibrionales bacterium]
MKDAKNTHSSFLGGFVLVLTLALVGYFLYTTNAFTMSGVERIMAEKIRIQQVGQ